MLKNHRKTIEKGRKMKNLFLRVINIFEEALAVALFQAFIVIILLKLAGII